MKSLRTIHNIMQRQRGAVFIVMLVFMVMGVAAFLVSSLNSSAIQIKRDQVTADALAQAKEALIGYAASVDLTSARPGNLPCPDINNNGSSDTPCGGNALGRLPWKTLGLPDLRDSSGERLWYAVSSNFKILPQSPTLLNSDTAGTITILSPNGNIIYDASLANGVAAVIIAPSDVLTRQGGTLQDRSGPDNGVAKNTASNYLDIVTGVENNADFFDAATNGFIQGRVKDANGNIIVNDQLLVITQDNIMQAIQKRVAAEVKLCLIEYASIPQNYGRYPWTTDPFNAASYNDTSNILFGRIPGQLFTKTNLDSGGIMKDTWGANCNIPYGSWWLNWKEMVFYGLAAAYKPFNPPSTPVICGTCLAVNPPSATADKKFVVIVAGKMLATTSPAQVRTSITDKQNMSNYMETPNSAGASPFAQSAPSATFNDTVVYQ